MINDYPELAISRVYCLNESEHSVVMAMRHTSRRLGYDRNGGTQQATEQYSYFARDAEKCRPENQSHIRDMKVSCLSVRDLAVVLARFTGVKPHSQKGPCEA